MQNPITKHRLSNGLLILLKEIHTAPLISQWIWYRVGSRNEIPGITGASHWVEHMLFKGSPQFPAGMLDKSISREGGYWNALTYLDWTTYLETMPVDKIDLVLRLEADRMVNSSFDLDEVNSERTVIISERQGNENEPLFLLGEQVQATAFQEHSYRHQVIGDLADLQRMQRDDLYDYYRSHYVPNNAVLALAGDFETRPMLDYLKDLYGQIPPGKAPHLTIRPETAQYSERQVTVEGPGETTYIQAAYRAPAGVHPDFFPFMVLDSLLTGPSSLDILGSGLSNKTSRLYRALVESELAVSISGGLQATIDPFLYQLTMIMHPDREASQVIAVLESEIQRIQDNPPDSTELERAVKQARALFAYGGERITNQAFWLGFSEMFADCEWFEKYLENLATVSPEDVQRIAQEYLVPQKRTLGLYIPTGNHVSSEPIFKGET